jgi:hypothetical protein
MWKGVVVESLSAIFKRKILPPFLGHSCGYRYLYYMRDHFSPQVGISPLLDGVFGRVFIVPIIKTNGQISSTTAAWRRRQTSGWSTFAVPPVATSRALRISLFESFLSVAEEDQARVLAQLANQDRLYLAFYEEDFSHRFTKILNHDEQQWQCLDELVAEAADYWEMISPEQRDFDQAKAEFMRWFM